MYGQRIGYRRYLNFMLVPGESGCKEDHLLHGSFQQGTIHLDENRSRDALLNQGNP